MRSLTTSTRAACAAGTLALAVAGTVVTQGTALAAKPANPGALTLAVFGDAPYGTSNGDSSQTSRFAAFVDAINADPAVIAVLDVGDIHSGKQCCTVDYNQRIAQEFSRLASSLVYTPGDNEWASLASPVRPWAKATWRCSRRRWRTTPRIPRTPPTSRT